MFVLFGTGLTRVLTCVVSHVSVGRTCVCKQGPERQCAVCHSDTSWQQGLLQWAHWSLANNLLSPLVSAPFSALSCHSPPSCGFSRQQFLFFLLPLPLLSSPLVLKVFYWGCKESVNTGERRALCCFFYLSVTVSAHLKRHFHQKQPQQNSLNSRGKALWKQLNDRWIIASQTVNSCTFKEL